MKMVSECEEPMELEAEYVFLLMKKEYRISRNTRAQWYFNNLNTVISIPKADKMEQFSGELEIISAKPQEPPPEWDWDTSHLYQYIITPSSAITFLSHTYCLVLCLDLSPSAASVDMLKGTVLLDEILTSFRHCVQGLARPFIVPGSQLLFCPKIYVTVIAHSPFWVPKGQQVIVAGWLLQQDNVNHFLELVQQAVSSMESNIASWTNLIEEHRIAQLAESERIVGGLFDSVNEKASEISHSPVTMATPEVGFISILRYGMLALQLLPENSSAGIIIFTDGVFGSTDAGTLEVLLTQLRHSTIGCSFVQVGSRTYHPGCSLGLLPDVDLMEFLASTTFGACLSEAPEVDSGYEYRMNLYHQAFLTWGFHKSLYWCTQTERNVNEWALSNRFFAATSVSRVQKKESESPVNSPLHSVLSCRLREGFTIKEVHLDEDVVEVRLVLPWRPSIQIEYAIRGQWPLTQGTVQCEVVVHGPYDFLHDVTCSKQALHSRYRQVIVQAYLSLLKNLSETDQLLAHLHSFSTNPVYHTVPDGIKSGVPLFYLPPNESSLVNASSDFAHPQFASFWRPVCVLDLGYWQRWLHSHRIGILLQHDRPLPKHLHLPSASGRHHAIQCRQAATALNAALRDFTTFVLLENHSYIGLLYTESDKPPFSFYLIRLTHKPPCVILRVAFLGGTPGYIRNKIVTDLKTIIQNLTFPQRLPVHRSKENYEPNVAIKCCKLLRKPAEKILVRYEKIPADFSSVLPHENVTKSNSNMQLNRISPSPGPISYVRSSSGTQWTTLSHYLYHRRWIWCIQNSPSLTLSLNSVARILGIITKMRLQEGFTFAHSASGIITMLLEVEMEENSCYGKNQEKSRISISSSCPCILQYVLFPPHNTVSSVKDSGSEDELTEGSDAQESTGQLEIVTECWIEPQTGMVYNSPPEREFFDGLNYSSLADAFYPLDLDCISSLVTFEHLSLMCNSPIRLERPSIQQPTIQVKCVEENPLKDDTVTFVPFCFQLPRILPKCNKAKLLFSTFVQDFTLPLTYTRCTSDSANDLLFELLTHNLAQLSHQEVILQENDCRLLLQHLNIQAAATIHSTNDENSNDIDTEMDIFATPRESNSTPRSPRDASSSNVSSRPALLTPLNISHRSVVSTSSFNSGSRVPLWRCFVKGISQSHILLVLLPASFQDLKLLMVNEEVLQNGNSPNLKKVSPDSSGSLEVPVDRTENDTGKLITTDACSTVDEDHWSQTPSRPSSLGPTRTNSLDVNLRPRVSSSAARLRAGSLDTPTLDRTCSIGSRTKISLNSAMLNSPFHPITLPSCSLSQLPISASVSLPIYVFDCPLSAVISDLLSRGTTRKEDFCKDHTFKDHDMPKCYTEENEEDGNGEKTRREGRGYPTPDSGLDEEASSTAKIISHYCNIIETLYCKCLGQALFTSLQQGKVFHNRDIEAAMDLCKETLLEVDITSFVQNICGHVKDFRMKSGVEILKRQGSLEDQEHKWHFPLSLLRLHQPCASLRYLHKLIRTRFEEILCLSFKPVSLQRNYYFYCPPDCQMTPDLLNNEMDAKDVSISFDEKEIIEFRRSQDLDYDDIDNDGTASSISASSRPIIDVDVDAEGDSEEESLQVPLFLHLTASVHCNKEVWSHPVTSLPTCLGDFLATLPSSTAVLDLNRVKITLDFLCLTFRSELDELSSAHNLRTTSFCSSSSGPIDGNSTVPTVPSQMESSEDDEISVEDDDRDGIVTRQLQHIPDIQKRAVKAAVAEIEWMLRDEIAAFLLDSFPIAESILETVVQHVQSSPHRQSCRKKTVPLRFVLNPQESYRRFLVEFSKISIQGHNLKEEKIYYYLVENGNRKRFHGSLDPPLGFNSKKGLVCPTSCLTSEGSTDGIHDILVETVSENEQGVANEEPFPQISSAGDADTIIDESTAKIDSSITTETNNDMIDSVVTLVPSSEDFKIGNLMDDTHIQFDSPARKSDKKRNESGTTSLPGRCSDSSSLVDSVRNTEDGYEGGTSGSDDECEWLKEMGVCRPKMPPFWLILRIDPDTVTSFYHCRYGLARPEELLLWKQIHEDLLDSIRALAKLINQRMLLKDLHDTRICNQLLEPESSDDIWNQDEGNNTKPDYSRSKSTDDYENQPAYLEAMLKFQPGTFACPQVWETHFPLHPRLKTGPGKLGTSKGVQQLRIVLNAFSVNNRNNMFVYQEDSGSVFYLRLHESSCVGHKTPSDSVSISRYTAEESESVIMSSSRRSSHWSYAERNFVDEEETRKRTGSFGERDSIDQMSVNSLNLNRSGQQPRREDCIVLRVHGITEAGLPIREDLVRVLQNKLDDAVLEVLHGLLSRNQACKLTSDDVHFIQRPNELPRSIVQFSIHTSALPYLPAINYYLRQNLLHFVYPPKYMDICPDHRFQDFSPNPVSDADIYLYHRPQGSGNRGIACIAVALVDGKGNAVGNLNWPKPLLAGNNEGSLDLPSMESLEMFIKTSRYIKDPSSKRPGPVALLEFRVWVRGHINMDDLSEKLESAIGHALWDVVLEYHLLPYPLCFNGTVDVSSINLPCSEPTTPVQLQEEEVFSDPRSRSVSFSGLPPQRQSGSGSHQGTAHNALADGKWKTRHMSGTYTKDSGPLSPLGGLQIRNSGPSSPVERIHERTLSSSSVVSSQLAPPVELNSMELGERGLLHPVYCTYIGKWLSMGINRGVPSMKRHEAQILAPLTVPLILKAFCSTVTPDTAVRIFSCVGEQIYYPCLASSLCRKQTSPEKKILNTNYILIGRSFSQWKESLTGDIILQENSQLALRLQKNHQRFLPFVADIHGSEIKSLNGDQDRNTEHVVSPFIPRQRLLWVTVKNKEWVMYSYNLNKDNQESLFKQCTALIQWHNARWALLSSIVAQKLGLFYNQQCSNRIWAHETLKNNPYLSSTELELLVKPPNPPAARDYNPGPSSRKPSHILPHTSHLEVYRDSKPIRLLSHAPYGQQWDPVYRHGQQWLEKRHNERKEEMQRLLIMWQQRSSASISITEDIIVLFKQVARTIHYCFTPLLYLPRWRIQVARTRDPNLATIAHSSQENLKSRHPSGNSLQSRSSPASSPPRNPRRSSDDHWHQSLCAAYLDAYVHYLHTLGFIQMEIKPQATKRGPKSALKNRTPDGEDRLRRLSLPARPNTGSGIGPNSTTPENQIMYFHKSHQGGILVCEVAVQEPFFYTKVHALEASRLLQTSSLGHSNVGHIASAHAHYTDRFLNECDHIKVLLHLHSFTYDYHLRSLYLYVSGRQHLLKTGFHLISFLNDFTKYYTKAPNFARNQVIANSLSIHDTTTSGEQLFNYLLNHERRYGFHVLRMVSSSPDTEDTNTEFVLARIWPLKAHYRDVTDVKNADEYDVTLLVAHDLAAEDSLTLQLKYFVILSSKHEFYPRLFIEKKPGKFRTISTVAPIKAASVPPPEISTSESDPALPTLSSTSTRGHEPLQHRDSTNSMASSYGKASNSDVFSSSNPEVSIIDQQKEEPNGLTSVPEENRNNSSAAAAVAAAANKHSSMRSPMFIRQEAINYLGYYTKHEQHMQDMMSDQARKAEELIRAIVVQAKVHCRRDTLWQRLQQIPAVSPLSFTEFSELLTLSYTEPMSNSEPQLGPLLAQPVSWYQGLAKLLLARFPDTQRHFSSPDGTAQHVVILNPRLPATAMMLSWDLHADRAELCGLYREIPNDADGSVISGVETGMNVRQIPMQAFIEEFVNVCCFHMWMGMLG